MKARPKYWCRRMDALIVTGMLTFCVMASTRGVSLGLALAAFFVLCYLGRFALWLAAPRWSLAQRLFERAERRCVELSSSGKADSSRSGVAGS